jgi:ribosomal protein L4
VGLLRVAGLNVYDVLRHPRMLVTKAAVVAIEARLADAPSSAGEVAE